ncbi:hypothetical protein T12_13495, partial [Trichinella patagoniensis]
LTGVEGDAIFEPPRYNLAEEPVYTGSNGYRPVVFSVGAGIVGFRNESGATILELWGDVPCE